MRIKEIWDDWVVCDEDGFRCGLSESSPQEVKKAYEDFLKKENENLLERIKL